jgi:hypothetical protein
MSPVLPPESAAQQAPGLRKRLSLVYEADVNAVSTRTGFAFAQGRGASQLVETATSTLERKTSYTHVRRASLTSSFVSETSTSMAGAASGAHPHVAQQSPLTSPRHQPKPLFSPASGLNPGGTMYDTLQRAHHAFAATVLSTVSESIDGEQPSPAPSSPPAWSAQPPQPNALASAMQTQGEPQRAGSARPHPVAAPAATAARAPPPLQPGSRQASAHLDTDGRLPPSSQ